MSKICYLITVLVGLLLPCSAVFAQSDAQSDTHDTKPIVEVVLLDNGRVLQGQVTRTVDQVHIQTREGSRIVISAKKVDSIFDSLSDVFQHRTAKTSDGDVQGHLSLFHWCLKHRLQGEAQQQLNRLMQMDIEARRLKSLDRQLVRTFEAPAVVPADKVAKSQSFSHRDVEPVFHPLPPVESQQEPIPTVMFDRAIALASHTESLAPVKKEAEESKSVRAPSKKTIQQELDSMMDLLDRKDLHQFQRRVQPILLKGCLAAKCHNSDASVMPLMHRGRGQLVPKRFTQRNLQSIVKWIDLNHADSSNLLTQSTVAHGGQKISALQVGSREFELLSAWLQSVVKNSPNLIPAPKSTTKPATIKQVGFEATTERKAHRTPRIDEALRTKGSPSKTTPKAMKSSDRLAKPVVDPFDPAAFNRLPK